MVGFIGIDVVLIYWAFRANYRAANSREVLELNSASLVGRRFTPRRQTRTWRFQPYWLRVSIADPRAHESRLVLSSHGRELVIGAFLTPTERREVAKALRCALAQIENVRHR